MQPVKFDDFGCRPSTSTILGADSQLRGIWVQTVECEGGFFFAEPGTTGGGKAAFLRKGGGRWVPRSFLPRGIGEKVVGAAPKLNVGI